MNNITFIPWIEWLEMLMSSNDGKFIVALIVVLILTMIDIATGYAKSLVLHVPSSDIGSKGLIKHLSGIILLCFMTIFSVMLGNIGLTFMWFINLFYIWTQFTSIVENLDALGVNVSIFKFFIKTIEEKDPDFKKYNDSIK